ncbi:MAG: hypothetical protein HOH19_08455 [Kordiimonadaceae bacterium]|jgi:pyruvate dehydrogenase E1 component alpha subunit|nr:hypothetical protein [Kordiimonadaceae bacterium]
MSTQSDNKFTGNPREPEPVPLAQADELGIKQVLDCDGNANGNLADPNLSEDEVRKFYEMMVLVRAIDDRGWKLQRSGRIAFWIPLLGQEAVQVGVTCALDDKDWIFRAHRELAVWLLRGKSLKMLFAQFYGAEEEPLRGRRLPCLIGSRDINLISSTTQVGASLPHAVGAAWAAKLLGGSEKFLIFFGDGSASRGEFHSAMNFAGIHQPPVMMVCVNNGWAVTTPLDRQTASANFAAKGDNYGVRNVRVDGNDPLALYAVTKDAHDNIEEYGPTLIEAVTFRLGYHTSSDNPDLYRHEQECELWKPWDPVRRLRLYMENKGWWDQTREDALIALHEKEIQEAVTAAEAMKIPGPASQFDDVFAETNWMIEEQKERILSEVKADD